jgi:hypothetical protein
MIQDPFRTFLDGAHRRVDMLSTMFSLDSEGSRVETEFFSLHKQTPIQFIIAKREKRRKNGEKKPFQTDARQTKQVCLARL